MTHSAPVRDSQPLSGDPAGLAEVRAVMAAAEPVALPADFAARPRRIDAAEREIRQDRTAELIGVMQLAHPDDLRVIAAAALLDLTRPAPAGPFATVAEDAHWWASMTTLLAELPLIARAAAHVFDPDFYHGQRKRLLLALFHALTPDERAAFLAHAGDSR